MDIDHLPSYSEKPNKKGSLSRFRFSLTHLIYAITVFSVTLATFGPRGIFAGVMVLGFWGIIYRTRNRKRVFAITLPIAVAGGYWFGLMLPAATESREAAHRTMCFGHLRQISMALLNYELAYGTFPPAYVADKSGRPIHSWRVLILPYLDENKLYNAYNFSEPWNGPNNSKLARRAPEVYLCPNRQDYSFARGTSYFAVVGPDTAWPGAKATSIKNVTDPLYNSLLVMEAEMPKVNWMEPRDLSVDEAARFVGARDRHWQSSPHHSDNFFYEYSGEHQAAFMDGEVRSLLDVLESDHAKAYFTIDGGENIFQMFPRTPYITIARRALIGNWIRLGVVVLIALWPLPWVFERRRSAD